MRKNVIFRWYRENDYKQVEDLAFQLTKLFGDPFDPRWFELYMGKRLMDNVSGCYVAVLGDEVIGIIFCDILRDPTGSQYGYISNMMIKSEYRGQGIGDRLLNEAKQYLTIAGVPRIWANVRDETEEMVHLFEKNGFSKKFSTFETRTKN
ncbi:MAG TPA: GNAT family N-acetyltransferase [Candidatus Lokiarchaeia archaeon]|nr:GNAT family N-acetyltransferase [Candidatus Lokiarchaeia archaeon]